MSNNKQTDIAELAINEYPFSNSERNAFINGYNKDACRMITKYEGFNKKGDMLLIKIGKIISK